MTKRKPRLPSTRQAFLRKVELFEQWIGSNDLPADVPLFSTIKSVREWEDQAYGVFAWTSFSVDQPGPKGVNGDLRLRLDSALVKLSLAQQLQRGLGKKPREERLAKSRLEKEVVSLVLQNETLLKERDIALEEAIGLKSVLQEKLDQIAELQSQIKLIVPIRQAR